MVSPINFGIQGETFASILEKKKNFGSFKEWPEDIVKASAVIEECFADTTDGSTYYGIDVGNIVVKEDVVNKRNYYQLPISVNGDTISKLSPEDLARFNEQLKIICTSLKELYPKYSFSFSYFNNSFVIIPK